MKRLGTVLVFKPDTPKAEAEKALDTIKDLLDPDYHYDWQTRQHLLYRINEFDDQFGGPVWYIP